jgi:hypothetical protein
MEEYVKVYSTNRSYINKVKDNYNMNNFSLLDEKLMLLIYTYEWFKIPKTNTFEKVIYHPLLTKSDQGIVDHIRTKYLLKTGLFGLVYFTLMNGIFISRFKHRPKVMLLKFSNALLTGIFTYIFWNTYLYNQLNKEVGAIKEFDKYMNLDVDLQKVIQELVNYNIKLI